MNTDELYDLCISSSQEFVHNSILPEVDDLEMLNWKYISDKKLSLNEYIKYSNRLDWDIASRHVKVEYLYILQSVINWQVFLSYNYIEYQDIASYIIDTNLILTHVHLPSDILEEMCCTFSHNQWKIISQYQQLENWFIHKYNDKLDWEVMSCFQCFSKEILEKYRKLIDIEDSWLFGKISDELYQEFK